MKSLKKKYRVDGLPTNRQSFYKDACEAYQLLCNKHVSALYSSMKTRLKSVIKHKGERIKY